MKILLTVSICICITFMLLSFMPVHGEEAIYSNVLRLHVLANSDSDEDQALKLKVRDAILEEATQITGTATNLDDAYALIQAGEDRLTVAAKKVISEEGFDYDVSIELGHEKYPTRSYDSLCFPSGEYLSLRVNIGEAEGKNWWCVLFPPLCLSAATGSYNEDAFISVGLTPDQYQMITDTSSPKYNVRFKILEVIEETFQ